MIAEKTRFCARKLTGENSTLESNQKSASSSDYITKITAVGTTIMSPNFPEDYGSSLDCRIDIEFPEHKRVQLQFQYFNIEYSSNCKWDTLEIIDPLDNSTLIPKGNKTTEIAKVNKSHASNSVKRCGPTLPAPFTSKGNKLRLRFKTNGVVNKKGLKLVATTGN